MALVRQTGRWGIRRSYQDRLMAAVVHGTTQKGKVDAQLYQKLQIIIDVMSPNVNCYGSSIPRHCGRHQTHQQKREVVDAGTLSSCRGTDCRGLFCDLNSQSLPLYLAIRL